MKNKVYYQKQKLNWNKSVKEYVTRSNFKQTRSRDKKGKKAKNNDYTLPFDSEMDLSSIFTLLKNNRNSDVLKALAGLFLATVLTEQNNDHNSDPEQEF